MSFPPDLHDSDRLPDAGPRDIDFHTQHPLFNDLCPQDSYTPDGTYWVSRRWTWDRACRSLENEWSNSCSPGLCASRLTRPAGPRAVPL